MVPSRTHRFDKTRLMCSLRCIISELAHKAAKAEALRVARLQQSSFSATLVDRLRISTVSYLRITAKDPFESVDVSSEAAATKARGKRRNQGRLRNARRRGRLGNYRRRKRTVSPSVDQRTRPLPPLPRTRAHRSNCNDNSAPTLGKRIYPIIDQVVDGSGFAVSVGLS